MVGDIVRTTPPALWTKVSAVLSALEALHTTCEVKAEPNPPCGFVYVMAIEVMPDRRHPRMRWELTGLGSANPQRMAMCMAVRRS